MEMMVIKFSQDDLEGMDMDYTGVCMGCARLRGGVEPDAEGCDCPGCHQPKVMALAVAAMSGRVVFG